MTYLDPEAILRINEILRLKASGFEQDWPIELSDARRVAEFASVYRNNFDLTNAEKKALMALIIASCDDAINEGSFDEDLWAQVLLLIRKDRALHEEIVEYWRQGSEVDAFEIARYLKIL